MSQPNPSFDIHQEITNRIVEALDTAGEFRLPWISSSGTAMKRPVNIVSGNAYNGVNILSLWVSAMASGFASNVWGTYRQWQEKGCQVRKGEKSSLVVFYKTYEADDTDPETGDAVTGQRLVAKASRVFNASQVEGYTLEAEKPLPETVFDPVTWVELFAAFTEARIEEGGDVACYIPSRDVILMPDRVRFVGTSTTTPAEAFYSTLCHELVHWSGAKHRLDRDLSGRFGGEAYAIEELVAELGAAFLCADLGITQEPRVDHARYIKNWLQALKNDKKAIFTAASKASQAAQYLMGMMAAE